MKICLIRHGETEWNNLGKTQGRENIPLNKAGVEQINEVANYLKGLDWKIVITSPLLRAKESAELIAKKIGNIEIIEEIDFIERDYGKASGMTADEKKLHFPDGNWPEAEKPEKLQNRTVKALFKYIQKYNGNNIIIVSHKAAINSILSYLYENELVFEKTTLKNACMTLLENTDKKVKVIYFNKLPNELWQN